MFKHYPGNLTGALTMLRWYLSQTFKFPIIMYANYIQR